MTTEELQNILAKVKCEGTRFEQWNFDFRVTPVPELHTHTLQCSFERPDADSPTGEMGKGWGRHWILPREPSETSIVKTAWLAMRQIVEHELMEAFTWDHYRVFDPHKSMESLAHHARVAPPKEPMFYGDHEEER